jgi:hypothetical protein
MENVEDNGSICNQLAPAENPFKFNEQLLDSTADCAKVVFAIPLDRLTGKVHEMH